MKPLKNYCIHVLLQRCKIWHVWVEKKIMIRKIKYAKNLNDLICLFKWVKQSVSTVCSFFSWCVAAESTRSCCGQFIVKHLASRENFAFKWGLTCHSLHTLLSWDSLPLYFFFFFFLKIWRWIVLSFSRLCGGKSPFTKPNITPGSEMKHL